MTCTKFVAVGIAPNAPVVVCAVEGKHVRHDGLLPGGGRLTWRTDVELRVPVFAGRPHWHGTPDRDDDPAYRAQMIDAGRGGLLR